MEKMQIDVKGSGDPLVLVGGGLTGWLSWEPHQARLAGTRRVARAQLLSVQYGLENQRLPEGYSVNLESDALAAAISSLQLDGPVDLVAWSYGGAITLDFALDHPELVRTLTLIEPPAFWVLTTSGRMDEQSQKESDAMRALYAAMHGGDVSEAELATFVRAAGLVPPGKSPEQLPAWPVWVEHRRSLLTEDAAWSHTDDPARLRAFVKPVLLVKGTGSAHFLHRIIDALDETLPNSMSVELPGGHAPQMVAMDEFLKRLAAFQEAR